jgi:3-hydroxyacyl-[acyl-carrier-protein] dehydratase
MAQTAAVLVVETLEGAAAGKLVYFMTIDDARFRKTVVPGDQLRLEVTKVRNRGPVWKFRGIGTVDGKIAAEANFTAMIMDD